MHVLEMQQAVADIEFPPDRRAAQAFASSKRMDFIPLTRSRPPVEPQAPLTLTTMASKGKSKLVKIFLKPAGPTITSCRAFNMGGLDAPSARSRPAVEPLMPLTITTTAAKSKSKLVKIFLKTIDPSITLCRGFKMSSLDAPFTRSRPPVEPPAPLTLTTTAGKGKSRLVKIFLKTADPTITLRRGIKMAAQPSALVNCALEHDAPCASSPLAPRSVRLLQIDGHGLREKVCCSL